MTTNDKISHALDEASRRRRINEHKMMIEYDKIAEQKEKCEKQLYGKMRKATKHEYLKWIDGHLNSGGAITHAYEYPMDLWNWYTATEDFEISPLYGSSDKNIIVPHGLNFTGSLGHTNIFKMDDFEACGGCVPVFSDLADTDAG